MNPIGEQLRELLDRRDFLPFRVRLVNSVIYDVSQNWQLLLLPSYICWYGPTEEWALFEYHSVTAVESLIAYI